MVRSLFVTVQPEETEGQAWDMFRNGLAVILAHTPQLEVLDCHNLKSFLIPEEGLYIFKRLSFLRSLRLSLCSNGKWHEATLQPLGHLTRLDDLRISVSAMSSEPLLLAQGLSRLICLTSLTVSRHVDTLADTTAASHAVATHNLAGVVRHLTRLDTLYLSGVVTGIPQSFGCLKLLQKLTVRNLHREGPVFEISTAFATCSPLQSLSLIGLSSASAELLPQICSIICQIQSLRSLHIHAFGLSNVDAKACSFSPHLTELELDLRLSMLPPCILSMTNLASLRFYAEAGSSCSVPPIGPYLYNLKSLSLWARPQDMSIAFLQAASRLEDLALLSDGDEWVISRHDIEKILVHRPAGCSVLVNEEEWLPAERSCLRHG